MDAPSGFFAVCTFKNKQDNVPKVYPPIDWEALVPWLTNHKQQENKDGVLWSPVTYKPGTLRGNNNVEAVSCLVIDVDDGTSVDDLIHRFRTPSGEALAFIYHSSYSSTAEHPKMRIIFLLLSPVPDAEWPDVYRKLVPYLVGNHADPACKDAARIYYLPSCPSSTYEQRFSGSREGVLLDPSVFPDPVEQEPVRPRVVKPAQGSGIPEGKPGADYNRQATAETVLNLIEVLGGKEAGRRGDIIDITRPGKSSGVSGDINAVGDTPNTFYCFTSSFPPFRAGESYTPFAVYGHVYHGGDLKAAASDLGKRGYGDPPFVKGEEYNASRPAPKVDINMGPDPVNDPTVDDVASEESAPVVPFWDIPIPSNGFNMTDLGNAERFANRHGKDMRYNAAFGWLVWDGKRWKMDESGEIMRRVSETVRSIYGEASECEHRAARLKTKKAQVLSDLEAGKTDDNTTANKLADNLEADIQKLTKRATALRAHAVKSEAAPRLEAAIKLAQSRPGIFAPAEAFDSDHDLLNVQNGVIDLRTGVLLPHDREFLCRKIASVPYLPDATCPVFLKALETWQPDPKNRAFLGRSAGYTLTGWTGEETAFFLFGDGRNGKGKFTGALLYMLGDYGATVNVNLFLSGGRNDQKEAASPELAGLAGKRMVLCSEILQSAKLNEARIKDVTGGDVIRARELFKNGFEFKPAFKLWLFGNHKPAIVGTDEGIRSRLPLIPFTVKIQKADRDTQLAKKLESEATGILAWAVRGCIDWRKHRLSPPASVISATEAYHKESDVIGQFLDTLCNFDNPNVFTSVAGLREALIQFCSEDGNKAPSANEFADYLKKNRGLEGSVLKWLNGKAVRCWEGISLVNEHKDSDAPPQSEDSGYYEGEF